ncbi:rhodanese-like domain-containing protein [Candidatus Woesearchaeota archaeon]|nr:rhodanese-like domain-containing protein [Candidatus Woesearchaeota archaeon]
MGTITKQGLKDLMQESQDFIILDVSRPDDFEFAHIPGAVNIPFEEDSFEERVLEKVPYKSATIILYGPYDIIDEAHYTLNEAGFDNVFVYKGGIEDWKESEYPLNLK